MKADDFMSELMMASEAVLKYLTDTNRPYSCADVTVNLRGAYSKTVVQKTLDALTESNKIRCKLYGKQKVYAALQPDNQEGDTEVEDYDVLLKSAKETFTAKSDALRKAEVTLKNLVSTPTTPAAKIQTDEARQRNEGLEAKLNSLRNTTEVISVDEKRSILTEHEKLLKEYRKRKRMSSEMLEAVMEGYPKSKKNLIEELCIETDEMAEFKLVSNT